MTQLCCFNVIRKTVLRRLAFTLGLLTVALLASATTIAQPSERWYQVEVIAFARQPQDQQEYWPHNIQLGYPLRWVTLQSMEPDANPDLAVEDPTLAADIPSADPRPFYLLSTSEHQLTRHATALSRDNRYRLLFHQAWHQPLGAARNAPAVLITGGNTYGDHHELEGSIAFSLGQLAEVKARLWLTQFEINHGQTPGDWPLLPKSPLLREQALLQQDLTEPDLAEPWSQAMLLEAPKELGDTYIPNRIVLLEEERRLRSNELNYLDHPLLGLIIQLTPYELPR